MDKRYKNSLNEKGRVRKTSERLRRNKLLFLGTTFCLCLTFIFGKVVYIKVVHGEEYERAAIEQDFQDASEASVVTAIRGSIVDREQKSLAVSTPVDDIILDVRKLNDVKIAEEKAKAKNPESKKNTYQDTLTNLNKYLGIPMETLNGYFVTDENGNLLDEYDKNYLKIAEDVDRVISTELMNSGVVHVFPVQDTERSYVYGSMAAPVLGFMRGDARWGLEQYYDKALSGIDGKVYSTYDEDNKPTTIEEDAQNGYSLVTTIDSTIQQYAEETVLEAGTKYKCENASAIVMDPNTGEILAMAQYAGFDNNDPTNIEKITSIEKQNQLSVLTPEEQIVELEKVWTNFNIGSSFEPGSIYKPSVVAAALEEGVITPTTTFYCGGSVDIYGTSIPCWYLNGHGTQTASEVLSNSCNVGMIEIAQKMGPEMFYKYQRDFGYRQKTGIDLPGEMSCGSSTLGYSLEQLENPVNLATSSMGQGFNNTAIQAINAMAAVVNGGNLMKPYVVSQVVDENGNIVYENSPTVQNKVISEKTSDWMRVALQQVVSPEGTGHRAVIEGYNIGGKTGTGQQGNRDDGINTLSFIGYFPVENPEIMVMTVIHKSPEADLQGSTSATPMARDLMVKIINYMGIKPSDTTAQAEDIISKENTIILEDLAGMNVVDATRYLNENGLNYEVVGSGGQTISRTVPEAGASVGAGARIYLYFENEENTENLIMIPDVTNISEQDAVDLLTNIGLTPVITDANPDDDIENKDEEVTGENDVSESTENPDENGSNAEQGRNVVEQMPKSKVYVPAGTEIKLRVE